MFDNTKTVIFFLKHSLRSCKVHTGRTNHIEDSHEMTWTNETLPQIFENIAETYGKKWRILLSEDFIHVVNIPISVSETVTPELIKSKAQQLIPEPLDETVWNYKEMLLIQKSTSDPGVKIIQFVAIVKSFLEILRVASIRAGVEIQLIDPLSCSLARLVKDEMDPVGILFAEEYIYMEVVQRGLVVSREKIVSDFNIDTLSQFLQYVKEKHSIVLLKIYLTGSKKPQIPADVQKLGIPEIMIKELDPVLSTASKEDVVSEIGKGLNINILHVDKQTYKQMVLHNEPENKPIDEPSKPVEKIETEKKEPTVPTEKSSGVVEESHTVKASEADSSPPSIPVPVAKHDDVDILPLKSNPAAVSAQPMVAQTVVSAPIAIRYAAPVSPSSPPVSNAGLAPATKKSFSFKPILIGLFVLLLLGVAGSGGYYFFSHGKKDTVVQPVTSDPTPSAKIEVTPTIAPTLSADERSKYAVSVQNGSGIAGEAARIGNILKKDKYTVVEMKNADKQDYTVTTVFFKKSVSESYKAEFGKTIKNEYPNYKIDLLGDNSTEDVKIIIGKK